MIDENTPEIPGSVHSLYSGSKGEAEKIVWKYVRQGLDVVIVNPAIILGAGLRGRSSVKLFEQASKGMPFYTEGVNGYVDVRDVCELMIRLAKNGAIRGERFVLCGGNYSYRVDDRFGLAFTGFRSSIHGKETGFHEGNGSLVST